MTYKLAKNEILILSKADFNPRHILECGQIFAYKKIEGGYEVFSNGKSAKIIDSGTGYTIKTANAGYFVNFFDLDNDYGEIKKRLNKFDILKKPIEFGSGIRILKNDPFEMIVSFIISANNNIKRIQKTIFALMERFGGKFPSQRELLGLEVEDFSALGLGYRAPQLYKALRQLDESQLAEWQKLPTTLLRQKLIALSGVGPKVADCILLFGYHRMDVFPVDTWISKMYNLYFPPLENREKIRQNLVEIFGDYSGYAQQYLFYYQRSGN